jgi:predicted transcriptional regulator
MSIRPEYAAKILSGEKRIELRRQRPKLEPGDVVVVYVTSPLSQIVGAFSVARVVSMGVEAMWRRHRPLLGVAREMYDAYFTDRETAYGIAIDRVWASNPVRLNTLRRRFDGFFPPQSYMYWPDRWALPSDWAR